MSGLLQIGELATQTGMSVDTIRFYEREGLLRTAARSSGGFRLFSKPDVDNLAFIRNAQDLGFSLDEIRELVRLKNTLHPDCQQVEHLLEHKISMVREKIAALRKLERELQRAMANCQSNLRKTSGQVEDCPVLNDISLKQGKKIK